MELPFSRTELERLLELVALGEEMLNAHRPEDERADRHDAALQKFYALADDAGLGYLIDVDETRDTLRASDALFCRIEEEIRRYDDCVFWDELAVRLAERDLRAELGASVFDALPAEERLERVERLAESYDREFDARGVEALRLPEGRASAKRRKRDPLAERLKKLFDDKS